MDRVPDDEAAGDEPEHDDESLFERLEEAAIQAEFETGEREETVEEARVGVIVRAARMTFGSLVTLVGIIALPLPGPGWLIIAGGLTILAKDVAWADRLLRIIRRRVPGIPEDGKIPRSSMATIAVMTAAAVAGSIWWSFARGDEAVALGTYPIEAIEPPSSSEEGAVYPTDSAPDGSDLGAVEVTTDGLILDLKCGGSIEAALDEVVEDEWTATSVVDSEIGPCPNWAERIQTRLESGNVSLTHETEGLVGWFFDDDHLARIDGGGTDEPWGIELGPIEPNG